MSQIGTPLTTPELYLTPEFVGAIQLSDDMQQALSLLAGFWRNKRVLLKASPAGVLFTASPQLQDIFHVTASSPNFVYKGDNVECTEILVMAHPENTGRIWVKPHAPAATTNAWPLVANDVTGLTLTNLNMLNLLIASNGDTAIIAYTM